MSCTKAIKSFLIRVGLVRPYTDLDVDEAEIENTHKERAKALDELHTEASAFKQTTAEITAATAKNLSELERLLCHIKTVGKATASVQSIVENMVREKRHQRR